MTDDSTHPDPSTDISALLERIDRSWRQFHAAIDGIPDDRMDDSGVSGEWSLKNLFGHLAFWDENAVRQIPRVLAGQPRAESDFQALNDADHAARRGRTLPEERSAMEQAHAELVEQLETIAGADGTALDAAIRVDTYEHYDEHRRDIEAWRRRNGI